jgi:hypothetical protein
MICAPRNPAVLGSERFGSTVSARMPAPCDLNRVAPFPDAGNDCLPATSVPTGSFHSASGRFSFAYIHHADPVGSLFGGQRSRVVDGDALCFSLRPARDQAGLWPIYSCGVSGPAALRGRRRNHPRWALRLGMGLLQVASERRREVWVWG